MQQLVVAGDLREFPCGGRNGNHHLNLPKAGFRSFVVGRKLPVRVLQGKERCVAIFGHIGTERAIDQSLERSALLPDAGIIRALDQHRSVDVRKGLHIAGKHLQRAVVGLLPAAIGRGEGGKDRCAAIFSGERESF